MLAALTLAVFTPACAATAQDAAPRPARVGAAPAQVRAFFDARSPGIAELAPGTPLRVLDVRTPWARVQAPAGFDVWMHKDFVAWQGADGTINTRNVNLRPLPSTEAHSSPLGRLDKGESVVRVGHEGDWFRVRAPERISAWILLAEIEILPNEPESWAADWSRAAGARAPRRDETPLPEPPPDPGDQPAAEKPQPAPAPAGRKDPVEARPASAPAGGAAPAPAAARAFPAAQIAKDPARWLALAHQELAQFRAGLAGTFDGWSDTRAVELEAAFTHVLWHSGLAADLDGARRGLAGVDALRNSYSSWLEFERAKQEQAGQALSAEVYARKLAALALAWGDDGSGGALVTGWVEKSGKGARPFALVRGHQRAAIQDFLDRYPLAEYAGQEVVMRGSWREEEAAPGGRVLAITELRVLQAGSR